MALWICFRAPPFIKSSREFALLMAISKKILIIGGGPAGVQAALAAAGHGHDITLVSDSPPGGRAAWQTLLPSKMWLDARLLPPDSRPVQRLKAAGALYPAQAAVPVPAGALSPGDPSSPPEIDLLGLRGRYEQVASVWQRQLLNDLKQAEVSFRLGTASFLSSRVIQVQPPEGGAVEQFSADAVIVAAGSVPYLPPGLFVDGERVFSPGLVWKMSALPHDMIIIGAGGPATEYVDAFSRLGVKVTWVTGPVGVLPAFPPDAGQFISRVMHRRGVRIITGMLPRQLENTARGVRLITGDGASYEAETAFVAIGQRPDFDRLNLPAAGLKPGSSGGLAVDSYGLTSAPHIYLAGDAAGPLAGNISLAQGRIAGLHAAGQSVEPFRPEHAVIAIYTEPQVAQVGRMSELTRQLYRVRVPFTACLRAHLLPKQPGIEGETGFIEVAYDSARRITGALAVCPEAAEILAPLAVALRARMTLDALASVYPAHPTFGELAVMAARLAR